MSVPIRVSQLTQASPVLSGDQLLISRGAGATGESYRVVAKELVCQMLSSVNTSTLNLSFDKISGIFKGEVTNVPISAGGTGGSTYLPGQILIGTASGSLASNFLTPGPRMVITNSSGTITLTPSATNLSTTYAPSSITILPTTGSSTSINAATNGSAGLMTNADRIKLDGIDTNANKYIHPNYSWTNPTLAGTDVISNLSVDSTGHLTNWTTRSLGTMATQNANAVNITGGTIEATDNIKSYNSGKTTLYAEIGPDSTNTTGSVRLKNAAGTPLEILPSSVTLNGTVGTQQGITLPNAPLCVESNCYVKGVVYAQGGFQYYNAGSGGWSVATSDARSKEIISEYNQGLTDILKLNPVKFKFKKNVEPFPGDNERIGLIAQEVESVFPSCVFKIPQKLDGIEQDVYQLDTKDLTFAFINAFKELSQKFETLEKKYNDLVETVNNNK